MRNRRLSVKSKIQFHAMHGIEAMEVRQPSLVDNFYFTESTCVNTGKKVVSYSHPIYMLFNQERIDRLGSGAVQQWLKSLENSGNSALSQLRAQCSDDDLLRLIKPRQVQSPSELERYINFLNERKDIFNEEVAKIVAERKEEEERRREQQMLAEQQAAKVETSKS